MVCNDFKTVVMRFKFKLRLIALLLACGFCFTFLRFVSFSNEDYGNGTSPSHVFRPKSGGKKHLLHSMRVIHDMETGNTSGGTKLSGGDTKRKQAHNDYNGVKTGDVKYEAVKAIEPVVEEASSLLHRIQTAVMVHADWQSLQQRHAYVYAAYYDLRQRAVTVVGLVEGKRARTTAKCAFWYEGRPDEPIIIPATFSIVPGTNPAPYLATLMKCPLTANQAVPDHVSLYVRAAKLQQRQIEATANILPVVNKGPRAQNGGTNRAESGPREIDESRMENGANDLHNNKDSGDTIGYEFTVCVSPLSGDVSVNQLVEFIEVNSFFGAGHFVIYNTSISPELHPYLQYYADQGIASVNAWSVPPEIHKLTSGHAELAALHECLYRTMYSTKYLIALSVNELLIPTRKRTWDALFQDKLLATGKQMTGGFSFQSVFFSSEAESEFSSHPAVQNYNILSLLHTYRENKIHTHRDRSRVVVMPERISQLDTDSVRKFITKEFRTLDVPYSHGLVFNYEKGAALRQKGAGLSKVKPEFTSVMEETRMNSFAEDIIFRITKVHDEVQTKA